MERWWRLSILLRASKNKGFLLKGPGRKIKAVIGGWRFHVAFFEELGGDGDGDFGGVVGAQGEADGAVVAGGGGFGEVVGEEAAFEGGGFGVGADDAEEGEVGEACGHARLQDFDEDGLVRAVAHGHEEHEGVFGEGVDVGGQGFFGEDGFVFVGVGGWEGRGEFVEPFGAVVDDGELAVEG